MFSGPNTAVRISVFLWHRVQVNSAVLKIAFDSNHKENRAIIILVTLHNVSEKGVSSADLFFFHYATMEDVLLTSRTADNCFVLIIE